MKLFRFREVNEAETHARQGKQALHLHDIVFDKSPRCFRDAVRVREEPIAHLFDLNISRLKQTGRRLGVKVIYIDHEGLPSQHLDLCGRPLVQCISNHLRRLLLKSCFGGKDHVAKTVHSIIEYLHFNWPGTKKWTLL